MLMQTNSYIVPRDKRTEHGRLMRRFRQALARFGCDQFEVFEQVGPGFAPLKENSRFVQIMRFRDRSHYEAVQQAERNDSAAQELIREFCELIDVEYQRRQSLFAVGFYAGALTPIAGPASASEQTEGASADAEGEENLAAQDFTTIGMSSKKQNSPGATES